MAKSKKKKSTTKKAGRISELKRALAKLKKQFSAHRKEAKADIAKLKKRVASHKKKSSAQVAKLKKQLAP
ncbi:MAG: hypothetical protein WBO15_15950, partial [Gammaproteobacteria bacterium]